MTSAEKPLTTVAVWLGESPSVPSLVDVMSIDDVRRLPLSLSEIHDHRMPRRGTVVDDVDPQLVTARHVRAGILDVSGGVCWAACDPRARRRRIRSARRWRRSPLPASPCLRPNPIPPLDTGEAYRLQGETLCRPTSRLPLLRRPPAASIYATPALPATNVSGVSSPRPRRRLRVRLLAGCLTVSLVAALWLVGSRHPSGGHPNERTRSAVPTDYCSPAQRISVRHEPAAFS